MKLNLICLLFLLAFSVVFSQEETQKPIPPIPALVAPPIPALVAPPPVPALTAPPPKLDSVMPVVAPAAPPVPAPAAPPAAPPKLDTVAPVVTPAIVPATKKLAIYVSGASDTSINKSLDIKLLVAMTQGGEYAGIADPGSFQDEIAKGDKSDIAQISQVAKQHSADYVCAVIVTEIFGTYSIAARLLKIADSQVVKIVSINHPLKSLDDLTAVSNELAKQLLPPPALAPIVAPPPAPLTVAVQEQNLITPSLDAAAKDAAKSESETSGLGWRGITRIAAFSATAIFGAATILRHFEAVNRSKELDNLRKPTGTDKAGLDAWKKQYNDKTDELHDKEIQRGIFAALAGVCAVSGVVTFFF